MPFIVVNGPPVQDLVSKRALVAGITEVVARVYGQPPENITVLIREDEAENVAVAGQLLVDRSKK